MSRSPAVAFTAAETSEAYADLFAPDQDVLSWLGRSGARAGGAR